jgi:NAD(P)-dependent dehydrogenase (short-subunit alcohol dehydrogenase family)
MPDETPSAFASFRSLEGRAVFVTGGGSGIGAAMVKAFHGQGARVAFADIAEAPSIALAERLDEGARRPLFLTCDLTDIESLRAAIGEAASTFGGLHVLINNAGNDDRHDVHRITPEYWDNRMAVNLRHQFFAAQAAYPYMKVAGGGAIINLSSPVG